MAVIKLFSHEQSRSSSSITNLEVDDNLNRYLFSVLWNKGTVCNLFLLNAQLAGGIWQHIITKVITDTDGEITVEVGHLLKGTKLNIVFGVQAVTSIDNLRIILTNATEMTPERLRPVKDTDVKKLVKGETFIDQITGHVLL